MMAGYEALKRAEVELVAVRKVPISSEASAKKSAP
jgi:hypothetical protein